MANKKISDLTAVSGVAAADLFEVQKSGETTSKKASLTQVTQVEVTARAAQDDVIEAGAGLNANGTFDAMTEAWYLRAADFATGLTDRGGAEASVTANLYNAVRMLDSKLYANVTQLNSMLKVATVNCSVADILSCNASPKVLLTASNHYVFEIISVTGQLDFTTPAYSAGTDKLEIIYANSGGIICELANAFLESGADCAYRAVMKTATEIMNVEQDISMRCATAPTSGNSTIRLTILYRQIPLMWP